MNTWARKSFKVGVLSAGVLLFAGTAANAADLNSAGNIGIANGNQANLVVQAPVDVCGNAVGVLGVASAGCEGGSWAALGDDAGANLNSFGNIGIGNGNQINAVIQAPIDVCGNAVGVLGAAQAGCRGGAAAVAGGDDQSGNDQHGRRHHHMSTTHVMASGTTQGTESAHVTESTTLNSFGNLGILNGNQANAVVQIPIDVCGNAIGVLGVAQASCVGGSSANIAGGNDEDATTLNSGFNVGIANGNQVSSVIQVPIDVCGNAIGVLGAAQASCVGGSSASIGGGDNGGSWNGGGNGGGSNMGGSWNGGGSKGDGYGYGKPGKPGKPGNSWGDEGTSSYNPQHSHPHGPSAGGGCSATLNSFGNIGILNGNQANLVLQAPVDVSGNAIGVLGAAQASSVGGASASC
jgi:ChpA-C